MIITITDAGRAAVNNAITHGFKVELTHIGVGTLGYQPTTMQTALKNEVDRAEISQVIHLSVTQKKLAAKFNSTKEYPVREVGFFTADGTLFGLLSNPDHLINYKTQNSQCIQTITLDLGSVDHNAIKLAIGTDNLNILMDEALISLATSSIQRIYRSIDDFEHSAELEKRIEIQMIDTATNTLRGIEKTHFYEEIIKELINNNNQHIEMLDEKHTKSIEQNTHNFQRIKQQLTSSIAEINYQVQTNNVVNATRYINNIDRITRSNNL